MLFRSHVRLPAAAWGEKDGTVTNSERRISRQRAVLDLPGEAKPDWWIVTQVARRMGWRTAFAYDRPADIFREHARLSAYQNDGARLFDLRAQVAIGNQAYDALAPFRWGGDAFVDGRFPTADGKARLIPVQQTALQDPLPKWPMTLNTGRYRDHWHTMTRTGLSPKLARHRDEPLVEVHPDDAADLGLADRGFARVSTPQGESLFRVTLSGGQRRGELFVPIHWTDQQSTGGRTGLLPRPLVDPHSGQPGFKSTPAAIAPVAVAWRGFLLAAGALGQPDCLWATRVRVPGGVLFELAGEGDPARLDALLPKGERVEAIDHARGSRRLAVLQDGKLAAAMFVTCDGRLPPREWLIAQIGEAASRTVLAGTAPGAREDRGPIICLCFDVGLKTIVAAIGSQQLTSVEAVGAALSAGTNCGSCRPSIRRILEENRSAANG